MKRYLLKLLPLLLVAMLLLTFSCGLAAKDLTLPEEESADSTGYGLITPSVDGLTLIPPLVPTPEITDGNLIIVIDPGHGNKDSGTLAVDGSYECTLTLKVAKYLKAYLEQYDNVTVYMTHEDPYNPRVATLDRVQRAAIAAGYGADVVISLHFNAVGGSGSVMLLSVLEEYRLTALGQSISNELSGLGIKSNSPLLRKSGSNEYWTDNVRLADYYGMIRQPAYYEIPAIIVEHCFVDNANDYYSFASSDAKLKALAEADGRGIVKHFKLNENISATTLESIRQSALQKLENQYASMDLSRYSAYHQNKIKTVYEDAKKRIGIANNSGKIDLTAERAVKTLQNYPKLGADETVFADVQKNDWFCPAV
ncbi:MAG: N-acetylmuramoyl-L-alanine amidase, partial [Firmicutes bacterium]|nr:N-acetylmuramoyl-L-alanine amidase [Bacillota bacterium]